MKHLLSLLLISLGTLVSSAQVESPVPRPGTTYIYEELLAPLTPSNYRCFIVFWQDSLGIHGRMNATTDEFYMSRAEFEPGYIVRPLKNIVVRDSLLSFEVDAGIEFDYPVPLPCKDEAAALRYKIPLWDPKSDNKPELIPIHRYKGVIRSDRFIIAEGEPFFAATIGEKRPFIRCN